VYHPKLNQRDSFMTPLWSAVGAMDSMGYFLRLWYEVQPPRFEIVNGTAIHQHKLRIHDEYGDHEDIEREMVQFRTMPEPVFRFADPAFKLDYFDAGMPCASLRLRHALGLTEAVISYRDIDLDDSPPAVRANEYRAFQLVNFADPVDWSRTSGEAVDVRRADGSAARQWRLIPPNPVGRPNRVYLRHDFVPPAPLFRATGTPWMLATDDLADKVMRAGITDLAFLDITSDRAQTELVFRQLKI
jgi:hypothetical protein